MSRYVDRLVRSDVLALTSLLWFMVLFLRYVLPPLFETFQAEFAIGTVELGIAYSGLLFAYSAMQFPAGWLADRVGRVEVIAAGGLCFSAAALLIALSRSWVLLLCGMLLVGVGTGGHKTVAIPLLSTRYDDSTGRTLGTMDMVGQFGGVVAPAAVVALGIVGTEWRALFVVAAGVGLALVADFYRRGRRATGFGTDSAPTDAGSEASDSATTSTGQSDAAADTYLTAFFQPTFALFVVVSMLVALAWGGVTAFLPLYLTTATDFSSNLANLLFGVLFAASLSQPLMGELSDRVGQMPVMALALVGATVAAAGLLLTSTPVVVGLCLAGFGVGIHGFRPVRDSYLDDAIPDALTGGTLGIARTMLILSGSVAPVLVSLVIDRLGYRPAFVGLSAVAALATVLLGVLLLTDDTGR